MKNDHSKIYLCVGLSRALRWRERKKKMKKKNKKIRAQIVAESIPKRAKRRRRPPSPTPYLTEIPISLLLGPSACYPRLP